MPSGPKKKGQKELPMLKRLINSRVLRVLGSQDSNPPVVYSYQVGVIS